MEIRTFLDRLEGDRAVLLDEDEQEAVVPAAWIPRAHEGQAVTIRLEDDPEREQDALDEAASLLRELQSRK